MFKFTKPKKAPYVDYSPTDASSYECRVESWITDIHMIVENFVNTISMLEGVADGAYKDWVRLLQKGKRFLETDEKELNAI
jgi:hypothetical protein